MSIETRLIDSLAEGLYETAINWRASALGGPPVWPRWFALHDDYKAVYREQAEALIQQWTAEGDE